MPQLVIKWTDEAARIKRGLSSCKRILLVVICLFFSINTMKRTDGVNVAHSRTDVSETFTQKETEEEDVSDI